MRKDREAGISVSEAGWDSDMVCQPCVFIHRGRRYMLYNGNRYGRDGIGLAVEVAFAVAEGKPDPLMIQAQVRIQNPVAVEILAGVAVTHSEYKGMIHAFFSMPPEIDGTAKAHAEASAALRRAFA